MDRIIQTTMVTLALITGLGVALAQDMCDSLGNSNAESELDPVREESFYLDVDNPAPYAGNITSWTVCYYGPFSVGNNEIFWALYAIYRRNNSAGSIDQYVRVSDIFTAVRSVEMFINGPIVDGEIAIRGFNCYNDTIDNGDSTQTVEAGDILGACVFAPDNTGNVVRRPLNLVGNVSGESLLEMNANGCNLINGAIPEIPSIVQISQLSTTNSRRLHLYANIAPFPNEETNISTPVCKVTTISTTEATPSDNQGRGGDLTPGAIAGLIVTFLLLGALGMASVVILLLYLVKCRQNNMGKYATEIVRDDGASATDNIMYGVSEAAGISNREATGGNVSSIHYEVPENSIIKDQNRHTDTVYEMTESTYAAPNVYEYATWGPNEADEGVDAYYSPLDEAVISYTKLLEKNKEEDIYGNIDEYLQPANKENEIYAQLSAWGLRNIPSSLVQIQGHLGSGLFGLVEKGLWRDGAKSVPVAVKLLKEGSSETDKVKFLQEAAIMAQFRHPNVVSLYGVVSNVEPLMLVVELIEKGDLRNYLHTLRPDPGQLPVATLPGLLLSFSQQVALGMHYLSSKGFVHRDLAARNILVSKDNICKVADFGMSRDLADETYYVSHGGVIPVKWTAPEAIHYKKYSTTSDVWSYGCLLYEIWSVGFKPFEGLGNTKVIRLVDSGKRLAPPPGCPRVIYELMIKCWNPVAGNRPVFREILLPLLDKTDVVLSIPPEALDTHSLAGVLGSSLEAGENMYHDLRHTYL